MLVIKDHDFISSKIWADHEQGEFKVQVYCDHNKPCMCSQFGHKQMHTFLSGTVFIDLLIN